MVALTAMALFNGFRASLYNYVYIATAWLLVVVSLCYAVKGHSYVYTYVATIFS